MFKKYALISACALLAPALCSAGKLAVFSEPAGGEIVLNQIRTGRFTPDTVTSLPDNAVTVSVLLENYRFEARSITPREDTLLSVSFSRRQGFDPLTITGESYGESAILQLPEAPVQSPWLINEIIEDRQSVVLSSGKHRIEWDGGIAYEPIDTILTIPPGCIAAPKFEFKRRYGRISLAVYPPNAAVYIDSALSGIGKVRKPVTAGTHTLTVSADGWIPLEKEILIFPGQTIRDSLVLLISPDKDGDGFNDTVDLCPASKGIYDGCPSIQRKEELKKLGSHFRNTFRSAPFTVEFAPISLQLRTSTNRRFDEIISLFNDGPALLNNYRGVQLLNKLWISRGFFIGSADWGYSLGGLRYKKSWDIPVTDDSLELIRYDSYEEINPALTIFTAGAQAGVQLRGDPFTFSLVTGYSHEIIEFGGITVIDSLTRKKTFVTEQYNNSFWNTTARAVVTVRKVPFTPSFYTEMSFAPNRKGYTGWIDTRLGVVIPWWKQKSTPEKQEIK